MNNILTKKQIIRKHTSKHTCTDKLWFLKISVFQYIYHLPANKFEQVKHLTFLYSLGSVQNQSGLQNNCRQGPGIIVIN